MNRRGRYEILPSLKQQIAYKSPSNNRPNVSLPYHRQILRIARGLPMSIAGSVWIMMMIYFLIYYETLPRLANGSRPIISEAYAIFPYISCVGAVRPVYFKATALTVSPLVVTGMTIDLYCFRHIVPGTWFRRAKWALTMLACVFLIALTFESINNVQSHLHLIFTSIQIWCSGASKVASWAQNRQIIYFAPRERHLRTSQVARFYIGFFAIFTSILTVVGIYSCDKAVGILPHSDVCWKLVSISAPSEWLLAICWVAFLFSIGFDNFHADEIRAHVEAQWRRYEVTGVRPRARGQPGEGRHLKILRQMGLLSADDDSEMRDDLIEAAGPTWNADGEKMLGVDGEMFLAERRLSSDPGYSSHGGPASGMGEDARSSKRVGLPLLAQPASAAKFPTPSAQNGYHEPLVDSMYDRSAVMDKEFA